MPLKITRRPFTSCPYLWELEVAGISVGEGECSEAQCEELNGTHLLTYRPCASKGQKLVWETDCEPSCGSTPRTCGESRYTLTVSGVTGPGDITLVNGTFTLSAELPLRPRCHTEAVIGNVCVYRSAEQMTSCDGTVGPVWYLGQQLSRFGDPGGWYLIAGIGAGIGGISGGGSQDTIYILVSGERCFLGDLSFDFGSTGCVSSTGWPATITLTDNGGDDCVTGPENGDATRGKFRLEYDIPTETFTLHSFERVLYPKYTLSDASPCDGDTKTLLLADKGDAADGCGVAPAEMTITRVCPPDRVGKSALLEDRKPNGATGKRKRQCGCDCLDEVDDRRQCATKCGGGTTGGCDECTCASEITWTVTLPDVIVPGHGLEPIPAGTYELTHDYFCTWKHIGHDSGNQFTLHFTISGGVPSFLIQASDSGLCCYSVATIVGDGPVSCDGSAIVVDSASQTHVDSTGVPSTLTLSPSSSCPDTSGSGPYNTAEGCENYPDEPGTACLYPEAINCCANTAGKDVPCAYTVEFECDLFFDIEDVRHKIAAKQVTLRRECYFEDPCLFVAPGPESSTGGSPVMDTDGFPGAQPVCSSCADLCLTGCTWSAYTVAACPPASGCDCGLALCYGTTPLTAHVGTIAGLTQTTIQLDQALPLDVIPACRTYVSFIGGIENRDVFGLNYAMFADLQLSERCLSLSLQYFDNSVSATTFQYATYTASVPDPIVCPDSIVFTKTSGGSVFPNTVEITNP